MVDLAGTWDLSTRRVFLAGIAILAIYNVARGLGAFGGFSDVSLLGLLCVFVVLACAHRTRSHRLGSGAWKTRAEARSTASSPS